MNLLKEKVTAKGKWSAGDRRSFVHKFTREEIEAFARLTGDANPLHVDPDYARRTPAGGPVVHGMLAASFVSTLVGMHIPGPGALWNSFQVDWRKMVRIGDGIRFEVRVAGVHSSTNTMDLEVSGVGSTDGEIYLEGKANVTMLPHEEPAEKAEATDGKRILVTGASGELGGAICRYLATTGARLVLWGRDQDRLNRLSAKVKKQVDGSYGVDLSNFKSVDSAVKQVLKEGGVYGFVHVAASPLSFVAVDDPRNQELLEEQWRISVAAFNQICQGLVPAMKKGGSIVHVLSQVVFDVPPAKQSAYVSAKMAAWGLVRSLALELGPKGIRCNAVSPGMMNTPYTQDFPVRTKQVEAATNPARRLCTVEDVAEVVAFLLGPQSSFINGVNLPVTGGARMP